MKDQPTPSLEDINKALREHYQKTLGERPNPVVEVESLSGAAAYLAVDTYAYRINAWVEDWEEQVRYAAETFAKRLARDLEGDPTATVVYLKGKPFPVMDSPPEIERGRIVGYIYFDYAVKE